MQKRISINPLGPGYLYDARFFLLSFSFPPLKFYVYLCATLWVMTDLKRLLSTISSLDYCPLFVHFLAYLAAASYCDFWVITF